MITDARTSASENKASHNLCPECPFVCFSPQQPSLFLFAFPLVWGRAQEPLNVKGCLKVIMGCTNVCSDVPGL